MLTSGKHANDMSSTVLLPGCGMCAVPFNSLHKDDLSKKQLERIQALIKKAIPIDFQLLQYRHAHGPCAELC